MASLLAKDAYLQGLARKICRQPSPEPQKRTSAGRTRGSEAAGPPKKKRRKAQKKSREREKAVELKTQALGGESPAPSGARKPAVCEEGEAFPSMRSPAHGDVEQGQLTPETLVTEPDSLFALDVVRQQLHEKIREARGQGQTVELSLAALEKRRRRKQERGRKKRKRKELRAKEKAAEAADLPRALPQEPLREDVPAGLLFNKVEVTAEQAASKAQRPKEKRRKLKGNLAPLTGRNYRQLLERLQARQALLEELRGRDEGKARELQSKMQWTSLLYKAEGVRIRDDEHRLQEALKRKEKRRAQRRRRWEKRTAHVVEKMRQRQDRRRRNLREKRAARAERRLEKARRKGRILPQDLERAGLA
ncbi:surfeit locus protein 6 isoform X1 [Enhydra lutris kenyoni]|uniref:Surfeit locus protein 6 isoform X1 n=1 Tax=Enhydra lutris kenyoni TaxID=391180 RepID=A0A2Y9J851_ENHLU|nr:surfeit locus protein 6 isoform X1 [Enhydra lutris kenyoni]